MKPHSRENEHAPELALAIDRSEIGSLQRFLGSDA